MIQQALLAVFLAFMIGGFVLIWDSPPESFLRQTNSQMDEHPQADSYMTAVTSQRFSALGSEQFKLSSPRIEFFQGQSTVNLEQPRFIGQGDIRRPIELSANSGHLDSANGRLELKDNVQALMTTAEGSATLTTARLTYLIDSSIARTDQPFKLLSEQSKASGTGLEIDLVNETFAIQSKVRVTHDPR
jgi:LPS export ABC transporter protein LptC